MAIAGLRDLCNPAYVYLIISLATVMIMYIQNFGSSTIYCLGMYECQVGSVGLIFFIKILYILFWTWRSRMVFLDTCFDTLFNIFYFINKFSVSIIDF